MGFMGAAQISYENIRIIEAFHGGRRNASEILKSIRESVLCDPDFTRYAKLLRITQYLMLTTMYPKKGSRNAEEKVEHSSE